MILVFYQDHFQKLKCFELFWIFRDIKYTPFPSYQISTSVPRIPVHVMKTLIAPTVMVLIAVLVNKDLLGMELSAQVGCITELVLLTEDGWI